MKNLITLLTCCLATISFADEIQPPAPSKPDGVIGGYEYVDLGLPSGTLWATYNVGATTPYERGHYFAWGDVEPCDNFTWESYVFFKGEETDPNYGTWIVLEDIGDDISGTQYDAARYQWGNGWRLPNEKERYELRMLCWNNGLSEENGVRGVRIYGPNGHNIFLPVCGYGPWYDSESPFHDTDGGYWTGVADSSYCYNGIPDPSNHAKTLVVDLSGLTSASSLKACGLNIRAVVNPKESGIDLTKAETGKASIVYRKGFIHVLGNHPTGTLTVYDLSGRVTYSGAVTDGVCQLPELSNGIYLVSYAGSRTTMITQKITVK